MSGSGSISGFTGTIPVTASLSGDGLRVTGAMQNPNLAGRDYRCLSGLLINYFYSTVSNPNSRYSASCDCWYVSDIDGESSGTHFFDGYAPPPPQQTTTPTTTPQTSPQTAPATPTPPDECSDGKDNDHDGLKDFDDPSCGAGEREGPKQMAKADAAWYAKEAIREMGHGLKAALKAGYGYKARCSRKQPAKWTCNVGWIVGDIDYFGPVTVWYKTDLTDDGWYYSAKIRRFDEYCAVVNKQRHKHRRCGKTFTVR